MIRQFDHVTTVVRDVEKAKKLFGLLGFEDATSVVISGEEMSRYRGIDGIEAKHVTLELLEWH
jgi:catechol 2,3-dioxygenase-like lactoylglutathione lyase family enzyme